MKIASSSIAVVCLGQRLYSNQTLPNSLLSRLEKVIEIIDNTTYVNKNESVSIIFSGSDTANCGLSEAKAMSTVYMNMWKSSPTIRDVITNIIQEEKSKNTIENAIYCKDIIKRNGYKKILLVTNEFHIPRAKLLFECVYQNDDIDIECFPSDSTKNNNDVNNKTNNCYRVVTDRPNDVNQWTLFERLDWEYNALQNINQQLMNYSIQSAELRRIHQAIIELKAMNYTITSINSKNGL